MLEVRPTIVTNSEFIHRFVIFEMKTLPIPNPDPVLYMFMSLHGHQTVTGSEAKRGRLVLFSGRIT